MFLRKLPGQIGGGVTGLLLGGPAALGKYGYQVVNTPYDSVGQIIFLSPFIVLVGAVTFVPALLGGAGRGFWKGVNIDEEGFFASIQAVATDLFTYHYDDEPSTTSNEDVEMSSEKDDESSSDKDDEMSSDSDKSSYEKDDEPRNKKSKSSHVGNSKTKIYKVLDQEEGHSKTKPKHNSISLAPLALSPETVRKAIADDQESEPEETNRRSLKL